MGQCTPNQYAKSAPKGALTSSSISQGSNTLSRKLKCSSKRPVLRNILEVKSPAGRLNEARKSMKIDSSNKIKIKVPDNKSSVLFKWIDDEVRIYSPKIAELPVEVIKEGNFQEKLAWFRSKIDQLKKSQEHGFEVIQICRQNIIESSINAIEGINLFKELRVKFTGDKAEDAGGGLLREWIHLCIKEIMSVEVGVFRLTNTDETAYQLVWDNKATDQSTFQALNLLGLLMSKALIEKVSINCPLDYTILRQLCSQPIHLSDVYSYDKELYQSWRSILEMNNVEELCLDGTASCSRADNGQIQVLPNGRNTLIDNSNKQAYIQSLIDFYCSKSIEGYLEQLFQSFTKFIPPTVFQIFQPFELSMLLCGPITIDLDDWRRNTVYDGYDCNDPLIEEFWRIVSSSGQQGYRNLLHYCTGSMRVPIGGFAQLETSHGHRKKFSIRRIPYSSENPYPKSYTCFNRLELPAYECLEELRQKLSFILKEQFSYFGLS